MSLEFIYFPNILNMYIGAHATSRLRPSTPRTQACAVDSLPEETSLGHSTRSELRGSEHGNSIVMYLRHNSAEEFPIVYFFKAIVYFFKRYILMFRTT